MRNRLLARNLQTSPRVLFWPPPPQFTRHERFLAKVALRAWRVLPSPGDDRYECSHITPNHER